MQDFKISIAELRNAIGTALAPRLFDVRRLAVYQASSGVLPAARWRDHSRADEWVRDLGRDPQVVIYCAHGHNLSQSAAAVLRERGVAARYLEGGIDAWIAEGGPTIVKDALPGRDEREPSRWVTRIQPKIDRIACPWLIRRFIDPDARFFFVSPEQVVAVAAELKAIPYDIAGVDLTHEGDGCTFDTLLSRFGLVDRHLQELALIIRGADTARLDLAPECAGLLATSLGNSALAGGDDRRALELGFPVYDALLAWRRFAAAETHNWPRRSA